ncbi:TPA: polysaccharide pyruvyl transferase family protein [Vibrio vulnificus]
MKIAILTQPLHHNYGGLLQAYALQQFLKDKGYIVSTVDVHYRKPRLFGIKGILTNFYNKFILKGKVDRVFPLSRSERRKLNINIDTFINDNINMTDRFYGVEELKKLNVNDFDVFIVGSDQVWRPSYSPGIGAYFFNFLPDNKKRISYAASFGVDNADEFIGLNKHHFSCLLSKFSGVSVREIAGVEVCKNTFNTKAAWVLDPTMILDTSHYLKLIESVSLPPLVDRLMVYVLDTSSQKNQFIRYLAKHTRLEPYVISLDDKNIYPMVQEWLNGFKSADFVVTDSFHGMVFSIIFKKNFLVLGNENRGMERFESLLSELGLLDRLIYDMDEDVEGKINKKIDYDEVSKVLSQRVKFSQKFLIDSILS